MGSKSDSSTKRAYMRLDFALEDEEKLIDYVKSNAALYNPTDKNYKNKMFRDRLWTKFGDTIKKSGNFSA